MKFFTYILECADKTLYTGYTDNLEKRVETHNSGKWAKYTRGRLPVVIKYYEAFATKSEAMKRENEIKKMKKYEKIAIITNSSNNIK